jgi:hypothetical protein
MLIAGTMLKIAPATAGILVEVRAERVDIVKGIHTPPIGERLGFRAFPVQGELA